MLRFIFVIVINILGTFKFGCFKIAQKSKVPIVPVTLVNSYKVFDSSYIGPITTQVHYLKPIRYEEYKNLKTFQIASLVKSRIQNKLDEIVLT